MNIEQVKDILIDNLSDDELISEYNEYCEYCNDMDSVVYSMYEFDEVVSNFTPMELARSIVYGEFNPYDDWFTFDGYGNLQSLKNSNIFDFFVENVDDDYIIKLAEECEEEYE
nr:MAG TPA: hypothetical protein [Caudoviricetes sp.]